MSEVFHCTICGEQITDGYMYGDGDGSGRRFAHPRCYHLRALDGTDGADRARALRWLAFELELAAVHWRAATTTAPAADTDALGTGE